MKPAYLVIIVLVAVVTGAVVTGAVVYCMSSSRTSDLELKVQFLEEKLDRTMAQVQELEKYRAERPLVAKRPIPGGKVLPDLEPGHPDLKPSKFDGIKRKPREED